MEKHIDVEVIKEFKDNIDGSIIAIFKVIKFSDIGNGEDLYVIFKMDKSNTIVDKRSTNSREKANFAYYDMILKKNHYLLDVEIYANRCQEYCVRHIKYSGKVEKFTGYTNYHYNSLQSYILTKYIENYFSIHTSINRFDHSVFSKPDPKIYAVIYANRKFCDRYIANTDMPVAALTAIPNDGEYLINVAPSYPNYSHFSGYIPVFDEVPKKLTLSQLLFHLEEDDEDLDNAIYNAIHNRIHNALWSNSQIGNILLWIVMKQHTKKGRKQLQKWYKEGLLNGHPENNKYMIDFCNELINQ